MKTGFCVGVVTGVGAVAAIILTLTICSPGENIGAQIILLLLSLILCTSCGFIYWNCRKKSVATTAIFPEGSSEEFYVAF